MTHDYVVSSTGFDRRYSLLHMPSYMSLCVESGYNRSFGLAL